MAQTREELIASLGLPDDASQADIDIAMAETLGDEEQAATLRAERDAAQTQMAQLDATDQQTIAATADAAAAAVTAADGAEQTARRPTGRLRIPDETKGRYVVLWARKPSKSDDHQDGRPGWQEVDVVAASGPDAAKRSVLADDAPFAAFLKASAAQKPGILLRAVPAMHWPQDVKPTTYTRPAPVLEIG